MKILVVFVLVLAIIGVREVKGEVVSLRKDTFAEYVGGQRGALVEFFAPWCGHCKKLEPEYTALGETFARHAGKVTIAKVDCTVESELCGDHGVSGYPTLQWFGVGQMEGEAYNGGRTADALGQFVAKKIGVRLSRARSAVTVLDDESFDEIALALDRDVLVEFYAPWCGHCKSLAPTYEKLAAAFAGDEKVVIANFDADAEREVPPRYGVTGFPTLILFPRGGAEHERYEGARDLETLVGFVNTHAGTQRLADGSLNSNAGRLAAFDLIAAGFLTSDDQAALIAEAQTLADQLDDDVSKFSAKIYLRSMQKISDKGPDYIASETSRLQRLLDSGNVNLSKSDQFTKRINILESFLSQ